MNIIAILPMTPNLAFNFLCRYKYPLKTNSSFFPNPFSCQDLPRNWNPFRFLNILTKSPNLEIFLELMCAFKVVSS
jgi:hypothetical protein